MNYQKLRLCVVFLIAFSVKGLYSQQTIPASGSNASGPAGSVNYSAGQVFYTTCEGTNGSVSQGVQQPYIISVVPDINAAGFIHLDYSVYPNPVCEYLIVKVDNPADKLLYQLYDSKGNLLVNKTMEDHETYINMTSFPPATYFLKIISKNTEVKTYKIIKN